MYVILVYDIGLQDKSGPGVLRKVFVKCKEFLNHIQNSVFEGELSASQFVRLKMELKAVIRDDKDSVVFFTLPDEKWLTKEVLGFSKNDCGNVL